MAKIIYEPHPVNAARKAKLQAEGYKILDAIFAPTGTPIHVKIEAEAEAIPLEASKALAEQEALEALAEQEALEASQETAEDAPAKRGRSKKG